MPEITHQQAEALRVLDWLLSEEDAHRRTGRTFTLALAYLRFACRRRGRESWIHVEDHTHATLNTREADRALLNTILDLAGRCNIDIDINPVRTSFQVVGIDSDAYRFLFEGFVESDIVTSLELEYSRIRGEEVRQAQQHRLASPAPEPEKPRRSLWERLEEDSV